MVPLPVSSPLLVKPPDLPNVLPLATWTVPDCVNGLTTCNLPGPFTFTVPVLLNAVMAVPIWPSVVGFQFSVPALVKVPTPEPE